MGGFTRRQIQIFANISIVNICNAFCFALQAPFYPAVAESKGAVASEYGFVFGIFQLVIFIVSPFYGHYITTIGSKFMMVAGVFTTGCTCILFGQLVFIDGTKAFLTLSFLVRIVEALGCAGCNTASFSIVAQEFPDSVGSVMATLETCFGIGLIIGPTIGGALYEVGGYVTPFAALGSCLVLCSIFTAYFLPSTDLTFDVHSETNALGLLKIPGILLSMFAILCASNNIGFLQAFLEPHLRFLHLSPLMLGLMFIVSGAAYGILAPIWGRLCDKGISTLLLTVIGSLIIIVAFLLIGPAPFIPLNTSLGLVLGSLCLNGIGLGGELVPSFAGAHRFAILAGFPQDMSTLGLVSGLWTSFFALGAFIGPTTAGILVDNFGHRNTTLFVVVLHSLLALSTLLYIVYKKITTQVGGFPLLNTSGDLQKYQNMCADELDVVLTEKSDLKKDKSPSYGSLASNQ